MQSERNDITGFWLPTLKYSSSYNSKQLLHDGGPCPLVHNPPDVHASPRPVEVMNGWLEG